MKTITIKAHGRPSVLQKTLQSILSNESCVDWFFCVSIDYSPEIEQVKQVVHNTLNGKVQYVVLEEKRNIGYGKNHLKALKYVFESMSSDWNLDFDDDYFVYPGWVELCNYYTDILMPSHPTIFSAHLLSLHPKDWVDGDPRFAFCEREVRIEPTFGNHGSVIRGSEWRGPYGKYVESEILKGNLNYEWMTSQWSRKHFFFGARPLVSRIEFQPNKGLNFTEKHCLESNASMAHTSARIPKEEFRLKNPYVLKAGRAFFTEREY